MKHYLTICLLLMVVLSSCQAKKTQKVKEEERVILDSIDQSVFDSFRNLADKTSLDTLAVGNRVVAVAKMFLQTPYVARTLEVNEKESLVVNLHELDCTTFLENTIALSNTFVDEKCDVQKFLDELVLIRYREGKLLDYSSRLHYFVDWIFENEQKEIVRNITEEIGGEKYVKTINFMSTHQNSYPALRANRFLASKIRASESEINERMHYYIPEEKIESLADKINNGDLIAITTSIKGLDVSHTGIAIFVNNQLHLLHASSKAKKVVISELPLSQMLLKNRNQTGIIVARLK